MSRKIQAWALLAALALSGPVVLMGALLGKAPERSCCQASCCHRADCPMRKMAEHKGMSCPMATAHGKSGREMKCSCSVSPKDEAVLSSSIFNWVFELPAQNSIEGLPSSNATGLERSGSVPETYIPPRDHPPKS